MFFLLIVENEKVGNMKIKLFIQFFIIIIIAFILELGIFNFKYFVSKFDTSKQYNLEYTLKDMAKVNWDIEADGKLISGSDANLVIENIDTYINTLCIEYIVNKKLSDVSIFYTNDKEIYFNGDNIRTISSPDNYLDISLKKQIKDLRIDLSDEKGILLNDINVIINPVSLRISFSRIIAIVLIYYSFISLFALQRSPTFDI